MPKPKHPIKQIHLNTTHQPPKHDKATSWLNVKGLFNSKNDNQQNHKQKQKQVIEELVQDTTKTEKKLKHHEKVKQETFNDEIKKTKKMRCSGSLCSNTKVMHRPETSSSPDVIKKRAAAASIAGSGSSSSKFESSSRSMKAPLIVTANSNNSAGHFKGMPFRRFSGCYECRMVVDPVLGIPRDSSLRSTICSCPDCGEIFMKAENLELHQAVKHAVSELGPEDTSKNIVEIIFQSSWLKKQAPICKIDRILKVHNTQRTISKFEEYRDSIKAKANKLIKKNPRCIADGNELLRFHCTTFTCSLGLNGMSNLCNSIPQCNVCGIIKNGFKESCNDHDGILTTATSGKAHDRANGDSSEKRAMLVCRVIAGRVKKHRNLAPSPECLSAERSIEHMDGNMEDYDSVAGEAGVYSNLDELYVFNPKAILPCFVVIYSGF